MKKVFFMALLLVLTAATGHAASDEIIASGVIYSYNINSGSYIVTGWDESTPVQSLHIVGELEDGFVEGIADEAFYGNEDIIYLTIDEGISYIGEDAFNGCKNIEIAILPEGLVTIKERAFAHCTSLTEFVIPSTVRDIQAQAFMGCTGVTDVYFLMDDASALNEFVWWDGWYQDVPGGYESHDPHGGLEFKTSRKPYTGDDPRIEHDPINGTIVHIPQGTLSIYDESSKLEAWLLQEGDGCYPLWWIVNYGVVGRDYTVCDDIMGVYVDGTGGLYAKDYGKWLTPDKVYPDEIDFMKGTHLMDSHGGYDQSNWVVLRNVASPSAYKGYAIDGSTITGTLLNKKNPEISVTSSPTKGAATNYEPNIYIPCSFMGRAQKGSNGNIYTFVQPKPQEPIKLMWTIYHGDNDGLNQFFIPAPDGAGVNAQKLAGGFDVDFALYEVPPVPELVEGGVYEFQAINRLKSLSDEQTPIMLKNDFNPIVPNVDGGVSDKFMVYPLVLSDEPLPTAITTVASYDSASELWYTIDGRCLGTTKPTVPGLYINGNKKVLFSGKMR